MIPIVDEVLATWATIRSRSADAPTPEMLPTPPLHSTDRIRLWVKQVDAAIQHVQTGASAALHEQLEDHRRRHAGHSSPLLHSVSAFSALGFVRYERAHSEAIAWCVDPRQPHGFGTTLLKSLLACIECDEARTMASLVNGTPPDAIRVHAEYPLQGQGRIDIVIIGNSDANPWVIAIEIKVDSGEGDKQLLRYTRGLSKSFPKHAPLRVFATPNGHAGTSAGRRKAGEDWHALSLKKVTAAFSAELSKAPRLPGSAFLSALTTGLIEDHWRISAGDGQATLTEGNSKQRLLAFLEMERHLHERT
ncbi:MULTISPECIES: PD-(D/E)XK nuclease family protein [unclassified Stenotrophomonas]|uniref:PD-(D/E)XK nuclease family protein n=1 Tax=unclassified Stenotrophomonas TaxID=196198 RepID=UPI0013120F08|nr:MULTISPECIES: PD-(D/E)XK nuclease family protein [unclassified Stenotrophomonas]MBN5160830.1 PD-(D/E)XK nuclease family protein [Stenotrophomonas maltophilia]MDG9845480.1 PD-(D/E)XK nuclease family protein [Stenotrophomonas sp. GD04054]MDH0017162.1 PD-(D/E)XK nuclease family protein [Stenotrophomonas sp. GD04028]MDH0577779.1 PD-(D/E)XK nuclease family protein [Stenotrophomonas sp. GD03997]MDH0861473.1 PD-(D/E)XK nuclease family protein [Stenotrophomonas sp. GD03882]